MAFTACLVCLVSTVSGCRKNPLEEQAPVLGIKHNLSNIIFLDIYGSNIRSFVGSVGRALLETILGILLGSK
jgi:hypothetical protein